MWILGNDLTDDFVSDSFVKKWLMTPVVYYFIILFIMPALLCILLWSTSLILYIHRVHKRRLMRRLTEAFDERDILKAGRNIVAAIWDAQVKFIYSEKATKFCEIFALLLSYVVPVKSKLKILQNFVAFSEYMNFICH